MSQSWQRFHEWMRAVAVVTFDLELGQKMEYCFPETVRLSVWGYLLLTSTWFCIDVQVLIPLSESEKSDVGYLSLPDTHSTTQPELESRFYFRICTKDTKEENRKVLQVHKKLRDEAEHYLEPEAKHLIGIAYFRQGKISPIWTLINMHSSRCKNSPRFLPKSCGYPDSTAVL